MAELSPVILQDIPDPDLGDINHPAATSSCETLGRFSYQQIESLINPCPPTGPLYTPQQALDLALFVSNTGLPNWKGSQVPIKSHLNLKALNSLLAGYTDQWVLRGSTYGWPLSRDPAVPLSGITWPNHTSCLKHLDQVNQYFEDEVSFGAVFRWGRLLLRFLPQSLLYRCCVSLSLLLSQKSGCVAICLSLLDALLMMVYRRTAMRVKPTNADFLPFGTI